MSVAPHRPVAGGRAVVLVLVGAAVLAPSSCAAGPGRPAPGDTRASPRPPSTAPTGSPGLHRLRVPGTDPVTGLVLAAPTAVPRVSLAAVLTRCGTAGAGCVDRHPDAVLARASSPGGPATLHPDGPVTPDLDLTPVWVLSWYGVRCRPVGPAPGPAVTTAPPGPPERRCTVRVVVDARTGRQVVEADASES